MGDRLTVPTTAHETERTATAVMYYDGERYYVGDVSHPGTWYFSCQYRVDADRALKRNWLDSSRRNV